MALNPVQSAFYRVHIENLAFNVSKTALCEFLKWACGLDAWPNLQMIRKPSGQYSHLCSCIFAVESKDKMLECMHSLNSVQYEHMVHLLGPGKWSLNAKEAYYPGAKRLLKATPPIEASEETAVISSAVSFFSDTN